MALFKEELVEGNSPYKQHKINEFEKDEAIGFVYMNEETRDSQDYGEFTVWQGVTFNTEAETEQELLESLELGSIIPNTILKNKQETGNLVAGELYKIVKTWDKGDKYKDKSGATKRAKGHGFDMYHLKLNTAFLKKVREFHDNIMKPKVEIEPDEDNSSESKSKPKI